MANHYYGTVGLFIDSCLTLSRSLLKGTSVLNCIKLSETSERCGEKKDREKVRAYSWDSKHISAFPPPSRNSNEWIHFARSTPECFMDPRLPKYFNCQHWERRREKKCSAFSGPDAVESGAITQKPLRKTVGMATRLLWLLRLADLPNQSVFALTSPVVIYTPAATPASLTLPLTGLPRTPC